MYQFAQFLVWYLVFVFSTTCHEAAHAFVAHRGGDSTAYSHGHVTLDPLPHIRREPFGMVLVPILSFVQLGWMIGWASVPYDAQWGSRYPKRWAVMSLAGPATNFLLAVVAFVALRALSSAGYFHLENVGGTSVGLVQLPVGTDLNSAQGALALALSVMLQMNVILGLYNLMPIPPLDGAAVVEGLAPPVIGRLYARFREIPMAPLLGLLLAWWTFPILMRPAFRLMAIALYS